MFHFSCNYVILGWCLGVVINDSPFTFSYILVMVINFMVSFKIEISSLMKTSRTPPRLFWNYSLAQQWKFVLFSMFITCLSLCLDCVLHKCRNYVCLSHFSTHHYALSAGTQVYLFSEYKCNTLFVDWWDF